VSTFLIITGGDAQTSKYVSAESMGEGSFAAAVTGEAGSGAEARAQVTRARRPSQSSAGSLT